MVVLRATRKVLRALPPSTAGEIPSDSALGDWYVNRIVVDNQPLLLLVSSTSLLAILARARDVRNLPLRLPAMVSERLVRLGIAGALIDAEVASMHPVQIGATRDRSVLGFLIASSDVKGLYERVLGLDVRVTQVLVKSMRIGAGRTRPEPHD